MEWRSRKIVMGGVLCAAYSVLLSNFVGLYVLNDTGSFSLNSHVFFVTLSATGVFSLITFIFPALGLGALVGSAILHLVFFGLIIYWSKKRWSTAIVMYFVIASINAYIGYRLINSIFV